MVKIMLPGGKMYTEQIRPFQAKLYAVIFLKRTFFILMLTCLFLFAVLNHRMHKDTDTFTENTESYKHSGLILDTPGCRIAKLDPFDPSIRHLIATKKPYVCRGNPVFLVTLPNSTIVLNNTVLKSHYKISPENVSCSYNAIYREKELEGFQRENFIKYGEKKNLRFGVPLGEEFIHVHCKLNRKEFTQYIPLVPIKPEVEKRASAAQEDIRNKLNVILIGIDSVSKLNFLRHFRKTHAFLTSNMSAFDVKGYTKVGDNTFPNLVPLLTGHFIEHYWNERLRSMFFDHLDFIWKDYSKKGYRTFYAEDSPYTGTFNYFKRGFQNPPTDYYFRPLSLAIESSDLKKMGKGYCLNDKLEVDIIYGYLRDFAKTMRDRPYLAFTMVSTLTHDHLNEAGYVDEPTYNLLNELWVDGIMNQSMVVIFSDHGIRFGSIRKTYIGKFEERMPFMYLSLPEWFLKENPTIGKNLKENQNRLITLFDIHATLHHLLDMNKTSSNGRKSTHWPNGPNGLKPNGLSLFGEISQYRTCEMANILPHWCPCQVYQYVPPTTEISIKVALAVIEDINRQLKPFEKVCARLILDEITDVRLGQANDMVVRFVKHENDVIDRHVVYGDKVASLPDYLVTFRSHPGGAMFEGTVRWHSAKNGTFQVLGISRINKYGEQSACIDSPILKKFCFCK